MTTARAAYSKKKRHDSRTYRSGLELSNADMLKSLGIEPHYEEYYLNYTVPESKHKYTPDFILPNGIIIETKGIWDSDDRKKHLLIREQYPNLDIRFVFSRAKTKLYKGSKTTYGDFCNKNNIKYSEKMIPKEWLEEPCSNNLDKVFIRKGCLKNVCK